MYATDRIRMSKRRDIVKGYTASSLSLFSALSGESVVAFFSLSRCSCSPSISATFMISVLKSLSPFSCGTTDETGDTLLDDGSEVTRAGLEILLISPLPLLLVGIGIDDWRLFVPAFCSVDDFLIPGKRIIPRIPRGESEFRSDCPRVLLKEMLVRFDGDFEGVFCLSSSGLGIPGRNPDGGDLDMGTRDVGVESPVVREFDCSSCEDDDLLAFVLPTGARETVAVFMKISSSFRLSLLSAASEFRKFSFPEVFGA